ncbi:TetR/AcrR family transcriptional regulator [Bacillus sp. FJAT-49736]|uniref:TetR/AcrR family transcriptional regulator n=1 Tax=Bacillus sp. FJAT-49736 TaxID=2833582 RepID=UPI001BC8EB13|nr:TetR/AcrR family transcriptional regulator [Bacillus sp. FJAT-49736]MBS4172780.1 TetR/AcrR family transcriptional regulator [Bacillus sp. FJAT-49736]
MARNKEFDPSIVLRKSMEIFGHYGYEGTSLQNLLDGLGIARQSLYDTYGTKRDLFISAVTHYINEKSATVISKLGSSGSVKVAISEIFYEGINVLKDDVKRKECFIMDSAIAQIPHDPEIAEFFNKDLKRLDEAFYKALVRAQEQGEIEMQKDIVALANYLNYSRYSLTQIAKLSSDPSELDVFVSVILSALE